MNCKNCRHWFVNPNIVIPGEPTEGKCLVSEIKTQSNQVCNAWELSRIAELEGERRWIPVGERLPEEKQNVLALDKTGTAYHWEYSRSLSNIFVSDYTHWMPLPTPPEVQE